MDPSHPPLRASQGSSVVDAAAARVLYPALIESETRGRESGWRVDESMPMEDTSSVFERVCVRARAFAADIDIPRAAEAEASEMASGGRKTGKGREEKRKMEMERGARRGIKKSSRKASVTDTRTIKEWWGKRKCVEITCCPTVGRLEIAMTELAREKKGEKRDKMLIKTLRRQQ